MVSGWQGPPRRCESGAGESADLGVDETGGLSRVGTWVKGSAFRLSQNHLVAAEKRIGQQAEQSRGEKQGRWHRKVKGREVEGVESLAECGQEVMEMNESTSAVGRTQAGQELNWGLGRDRGSRAATVWPGSMV